MSNFTTNLCPNPSFEVSLAGYSPLNGALLGLSPVAMFGLQSMEVTTPGLVSGEGFVSVSGLVPAVGTGSASVFLFGASGNLTVSAAVSPSPGGGSVLSSVPVTLTGTEWQRVVLNGLSLLAGQELYLIVQTTQAEALTFWVDGVQLEPESPANPYCDGDQPFCQWTGTPELSPSFQQYQFPTGSVGGMFLDGTATPVNFGQQFLTGSVGTMLLSGTASPVVVNPVAAVNDFAIFQATDPDPAQTFPSWTNSGQSTGQTGYNRTYSLVVPPVDYPVSQGNLWNRAAYMALGLFFNSVAAGQAQDIADAQIALLPYVYGSAAAPRAYTNPRQVQTIVKPTRLNFIPNPSIEVSTVNWNPVGTASLSRDTTQATPNTGSLASLKVTVNAAGDGATITVPELIFGDTYTVSAWTQGGPGLFDVTMQCAGVNASSVNQGTGYGEGTFGGGFYGGASVNTDMASGQWFQPVLIFTATASTMQLNFVSLVDPGDVAYPTEFWVDAVLMEAGDTLGTYFDGSSGGVTNFNTNPDDYSWGSASAYGGAAVNGVNAQSFYYQRSIVTGANPDNVTGGIVQQVLNQHTPLGITAAAPVYNAAPTQ